MNADIAEVVGVLKELARAFLRFDRYPRIGGKRSEERSDWDTLLGPLDWASVLDCGSVGVLISFAADVGLFVLSWASRNIGETSTRCVSWESSLLWHRS